MLSGRVVKALVAKTKIPWFDSPAETKFWHWLKFDFRKVYLSTSRFKLLHVVTESEVPSVNIWKTSFDHLVALWGVALWVQWIRDPHQRYNARL